MDTNPDRSVDPLSPVLEALGPGLALIGFPTFVVDAQLRYRFVNAAYEQYFGRAAGDLVGRSVDEIHGPPPSDGRREALLQALAGESLTFDRQARHGPNAGQWARLHYMPIRAGAAVVGVNIVLVSIQHLKEAQEAIAARERQLALITDTIGFPLTYVDREGIVRFANAQSAAWTGLKPEDMIGRPARDLAPPAIAAQSLPLLERTFAGEAIVYERAALWPGRESRRIRGHMIPDRDASGVVRGAIIVVLDIEEDHRLKEALLARTRELQLLTENVGVPMAYIGADRRFRFVNTPGLDWLPGVTIENIVGRHVDEVYSPEIVAAVRGNLERALGGEVVAYERQGNTPGGERRWVRVTLIPDKADDGGVRGVYTIVIDIDEDRRLREALETQGRELRFFTDNIPVSVAYLDTQRRYVFVNRAFAQARGTTREEIIGRTAEEVIGRKAADELAPLVKRVLAGETTTYEREIALPSGEKRWFHVRSVPDFGPDGAIRGMYVVGHDVQELKVAQASLQEKEQELREVIDSIPTPMVYVDSGQRYRYVNDAFLNYVNGRRERIIGRQVREVLGPERHDALKPVLERVLAGETVTITRPIVYFDGRSRWMHIRYTPRRDATGRVLGYYATTSDIHEQKAVEEELRRANSILSAHFENTPLAVIEWDPSLRVIRWSGSAGTIFGWSADEMLGRTVAHRDFTYADDAPAVNAMVRRLFDGPAAQATILNRNHRKDGSVAWVEWHNSALRDASGAVVSILSLAQDVSSRIQAEERLQFMATHDGLTGLPNRVLLTDRLTSAISRAQRSGAGMAVLFLDLDHFKDVNDTFGHRIGDELLKSLARRVRGSLRQSDLLVRLSGDEFVIVLEGLESDAGPDRVAQKILDDVMRPFAIENHEVQVSASLGYAVFPADGGDPETLLKNADAAMYHAKELGRSSYRAFSKSLAQRRDRRLEIEQALKRAIRKGEFELYYQPILDVGAGHVSHVEALVRWRDPAKGLVMPLTFIPVAEEAGLMRDLGHWVFETAARQAAAWRAAGIGDFTVSVNLSASQLRDSTIVSELEAILAKTGCAPSWLTVEITETSMVKDVEGVSHTLRRLRRLGLRIAIDDFGTGFSSLSHLRHMPVDSLKIDKSFVADIERGGRGASEGGGAAIVAAVTGLARGLGLDVVAEGVEHPAQLAFLRAQGCIAYQGYLATPPLPLPDFESWLGKHMHAAQPGTVPPSAGAAP